MNKYCPCCGQEIIREINIGDYVLVNRNVDSIYSKYIGRQGNIVDKNDDNSYTVRLPEEDIYIFDHEFDLI